MAVVVSAVATPAFAAQPVHCPTCVTDSDFRQRALLEESVTNAGGTFWVYNLSTGAVTKWYIPPSKHADGEDQPSGSLVTKAAAIKSQ